MVFLFFSSFLESPWVDFSNLLTGETDEAVWLCSVPGGPLRGAKTGRTKTAPGHLYYAVFSVIYHCVVSLAPPRTPFNLFLFSVGLSVLNIVIIWFLKRKKKTLNKFFFI